MTTKPPPVPPANRSPKGTGDPKTGAATDDKPRRPHEHDGEEDNIKQNTTNQGYQQGR
jgi:hypothetical protein